MKIYGGLKIIKLDNGNYFVEIDKCPYTYELQDISSSIGEEDLPVFSVTVVSSTPASSYPPLRIHVYQDGVISCDSTDGRKTDMDVYYLRTQADNLYTFLYDATSLDYVTFLSQGQVAGLVSRYITLKRKYDLIMKRFCDIILTNRPLTEKEKEHAASLRKVAAAKLQSGCKSADGSDKCCRE